MKNDPNKLARDGIGVAITIVLILAFLGIVIVVESIFYS